MTAVAPVGLRFWLFSAALLGACHEPAGTSSLGPRSSSPLSPSATLGADSSRLRDSAPTHSGSGSDAAPPAGSGATAVALDAGSSIVSDAGVSDAGSAGHPIPAGDAPPALVDDGGKPLPQTKDRPSTASVAFRAR